MSKKTTATKQRSPKPSTDGKKRPQRSRPQPKPEGVQKMATATAPASDRLTISCLGQIGETAGQIWHLLDESGPMSLTKLVKTVDAPRDTVMQAIGWLAREDKVDIDETSRGRVVSLR
jgi:hypothetical protein